MKCTYSIVSSDSGVHLKKLSVTTKEPMGSIEIMMHLEAFALESKKSLLNLSMVITFSL
jgi:hypothetical protein